MRYQDWLKTVPSEITGDPLWKMKVYKYALFASDIAWSDIAHLSKKRILISLCDQLYRATGSVGANLEEGYSRKSKLDRARFFEYSLGSGRESRGWYYRARHSLPDKIYQSRLTLLTEIVKLLLHIVPSERGNSAKEPEIDYLIDSIDHFQLTSEKIETLEIPLL